MGVEWGTEVIPPGRGIQLHLSATVYIITVWQEVHVGVWKEQESRIYTKQEHDVPSKMCDRKTLMNKQQSSNRFTVQEHHTRHTVHTALSLVQDGNQSERRTVI